LTINRDYLESAKLKTTNKAVSEQFFKNCFIVLTINRDYLESAKLKTAK
jgi:hypothetical protein